MPNQQINFYSASDLPHQEKPAMMAEDIDPSTLPDASHAVSGTRDASAREQVPQIVLNDQASHEPQVLTAKEATAGTSQDGARYTEPEQQVAFEESADGPGLPVAVAVAEESEPVEGGGGAAPAEERLAVTQLSKSPRHIEADGLQKVE